ncbi:MAG: Ig domain-containing protein [Candidatus Scatosoma sp.]
MPRSGIKNQKENKTENRFFCVFACLAAIFASCFFTRSCAKTADEPEGKIRFTLSREEIELFEGEEYVLYLIKTPADGKKTPASWRAGDTKIAEVNGGKIRAKQAGETFVCAQTKEYTLSCKVTVKKRDA